MFRKIVIGTDLTEFSTDALRMGCKIARENGAEVVVLYAIDKPHEASHWLSNMFDEELAGYSSALERERQIAVELIGKQIATSADANGLTLQTVVRMGRGPETIVAAADELGADLIVVGTRRRIGTIGSSAEQVVRTAGRPVLVIPAARPSDA